MMKKNLERMFNGNENLVIIPNFIEDNRCDKIASQLMSNHFTQYENVAFPIEKIGPAIYEYQSSDINSYFKDKDRAQKIKDEIFKQMSSPDKDLNQLFQDYRPRPATTKSNESLYHGIFRKIEKAAPYHIDYAPHESPDWWEPSKVEKAYALNIYLTDFECGEMIITNKRWKNKADDQHIIKDLNFGYEDSFVLDSETSTTTYKPKKGDLMIIDSRYYHKVNKAIGDRITYSTNLAINLDNQMIFWS